MTAPSGTGILSTGKQNRRRGSGFSEVENSKLFVHIGSVLPIISHHWNNVCTLLAEKFSSRTPESLRRKYNSLVRQKPNTGDPHCPWQVRAAKTLLSSIRTKTELETETLHYNLHTINVEIYRYR